MPILPLPPSSLNSGDLPVVDENDIINLLPAFLRPTDPSPVRDAIISAFTEIMLRYQQLSEESLAYADVLRSLDSALTGLGEDRGVFRGTDEDNETLRERILSIPNLVTPTSIVAAVNSLLSPHTTVQCQYSESVGDRWYIGGSSPRDWHSYVWGSNSSHSPTYPDRLYLEDQSRNLGYYVPNRDPGGARVYSSTVGRLFMIRIPDLSNVDNLGGFINSDDLGKRFYVGSGGGMTAVRNIGTTKTDLFNLIASTINRLKAQSIRYILLIDPKLK